MLSSLAIIGCATRLKYDEKIKSHVGETADQLVSELGPPTSTFLTDSGKKIYTYIRDAGATAHYDSFLKTAVVKQHTCSTSFTLDKGIVESYRFEGNACKSR